MGEERQKDKKDSRSIVSYSWAGSAFKKEMGIGSVFCHPLDSNDSSLKDYMEGL